jgi:hypothetical protein
MASMIWQATCGSGHPTGIDPTITPSWPRRAVWRAIQQVPTLRLIPAEPPEKRKYIGGIVSVHRSVLLTVHGGYARQGGSQHRYESPRFSLRDHIVGSICGRSGRYRLQGLRKSFAIMVNQCRLRATSFWLSRLCQVRPVSLLGNRFWKKVCVANRQHRRRRPPGLATHPRRL